MKIRSIRRITNDHRHNAFTGCCWFKNHLYVAYRQGDAHVCPFGRIVVLRSRDEGLSWEHVAVLRGPSDTRDPHLYSDGERLIAVAFVSHTRAGGWKFRSGHAWTRDGDRWTPWRPFEGTGSAILWRPTFFRGRHYCAGYLVNDTDDRHAAPSSLVYWYESPDGRRWRRIRLLHAGADQPNECFIEIRPDGRATMLMRCEGRDGHPILWRSRYPFRAWSKRVLADISIGGPCLWTVDEDTYVSGRWYPKGRGEPLAHTAIFKIAGSRCRLQCVLPTGPHLDHSYMAVARHPGNNHRFFMSFYSDAVAPSDPTVPQWSHPDIYVADAVFKAPYLRTGFRVSALQSDLTLDDAPCPDVQNPSLAFRPARAGASPIEADFLDVSATIRGRAGVVYLVRDLRTAKGGPLRWLLGYDGPVKVWWNGREVFRGPGTNPALPDETSISVEARPGPNQLAIALDTHDGKAQGVFVRWERT